MTSSSPATSERATEKGLIETYELPELDVLMAGHHGSKNSTSKELLDAVTPGTVIISVGSNSYGHPAEDTLRRLARAGCDIYRTDRTGRSIYHLIREHIMAYAKKTAKGTKPIKN